ncbi:MAG TPA: serine hydrolase domain-containing protein [Pirellulales bacterium]|jgi:CubicO group peptidase (beta-lactamase class C family)|nr:serine hydrolase domain-containing protein [Pirellulales bacterium]
MPSHLSDSTPFWATLLAPFTLLTALASWAAADGPNPVAPLQKFVENHTLAGAVGLVATKDQVLAVDAVGFADIAQQTPMRTDCLFWIASQSKSMTATALMMLVDEGKVHVEDPVEKYLPEFQGQQWIAEQTDDRTVLKRPSRPITIHDILSHTSGLPFMSRVEHKIDQLSLHEASISYALTPLRTEPGSKYDYSNAGLNTAGRIIEVVSGMPYETFLQKRLFDPLGMHDTTFWPTAEQIKRIAKSYKPNAAQDGLEEIQIDQLTYPLSDRRRGPSPAGGLFSTAADVARFCQMVLNHGSLAGHRYLSPEAVQQMTSKQTRDLSSSYGFGWQTSADPHGSFGHGGAYSTHMEIDPAHGLITVFLVQHAGYPGPNGKLVYPTFIEATKQFIAK